MKTNRHFTTSLFAALLATASLLLMLIAPPRAAAQPSSIGEWGPVQNWSIVAVHMNLLPTGKLLFWPYGDDPHLYDPATGGITLAAKVGENPF